MSVLDGILKQVAGSPDTVAELASKVGIDPALASKAVAALGKSHGEAGDTVELASARTGLDAGKLTEIVGQLGGDNALGEIVEKLGGDSSLSGIIDMLDIDGDGNPLDDIAGMAGKFFGKN